MAIVLSGVKIFCIAKRIKDTAAKQKPPPDFLAVNGAAFYSIYKNGFSGLNPSAGYLNQRGVIEDSEGNPAADVSDPFRSINQDEDSIV